MEVVKDANGNVRSRELFGVRYVPLTDLRHQLQ
jgi:protein-L-isoaspartate O-methyltransferase